MEFELSLLARGAVTLLQEAGDVFLAPGSVFSAASLLSALVIAAAHLAWARMSRGRTVRLKLLVRALFPRRVVAAASTRADLGLFLFNTFVAALLLGWALMSAHQISGPVAAGLRQNFGDHPALAAPSWAVGGLCTVVLFLAYELAYWLDHALSHRIPILWDFHKSHHTAEVLTPLTVFRVHPIDSLVFANITAVVMGLTGGLLDYALGGHAAPFAISGTNVILVAFVFATVHLQHSQLWIAFTGPLGRILVSPAHHQIHHSCDPAHFNRNFGSCLAIWDWLFGTLHVPSKTRESLTFGAEIEAGAPSPHSAAGILLTPFADATRRLAGTRRRMGAAASRG